VKFNYDALTCAIKSLPWPWYNRSTRQCWQFLCTFSAVWRMILCAI